MKPRRLKLLREDLEKQANKGIRRMQKIAEEVRQIRQILEKMDTMPKQVPFVKETENAVHNTGA